MKQSALESFDVVIARIADPIGCHIRYYPTEQACVMDQPIILEFWDKESYQNAFRHARKCKHNGLLKRLMT